jgi:hypothetical protein
VRELRPPHAEGKAVSSDLGIRGIGDGVAVKGGDSFSSFMRARQFKFALGTKELI